MKITKFNKVEDHNTKIASFAIEIPEWHVTISNMAAIKSKDGNGYFIVLPTQKNRDTGEWEKIVEFDQEAHKSFIRSAREALQKYLQQENITLT